MITLPIINLNLALMSDPTQFIVPLAIAHRLMAH